MLVISCEKFSKLIKRISIQEGDSSALRSAGFDCLGFGSSIILQRWNATSAKFLSV